MKHAAYDAIGSAYEDYARSATMKRAECHSVLAMVGDLAGKRVLDLACGTGFYSRQLEARGASSVLGVDLSPEMIRVAREIEAREPRGIAYRVADATAEHLGTFDLVNAVWLLNYAESREQLQRMVRSVAGALAPGGRFVAFTINPDFDHRTSQSAKYGVRIVSEEREDDHVLCHGEFVTDPPMPVDVRRFSRAAYDDAFRRAGFASHQWVPAGPSAADLDELGEAYWQDFVANCIGIGIVATR